ncbi:hypothetical protein [Tropicimonas sediminicola]|uniref:Uncharacterized protein n=1 Tax=Tropicimonas sediminicola TaxID=1031541 RepID=A0A239FBK7_9RHOB|nr:hypothetical protein [Tropicimonas sediminicola]SNS53474.1 hypothetical protein SAMN05421757_102563 [Tropicimonas sediminicola]
MSELSDPVLEGRLIALRHILCLLASGHAGADLLAALDTVVQDGQEDPGASAEDAVDAIAFAIRQAKADEERAFRNLLEIALQSGKG